MERAQAGVNGCEHAFLGKATEDVFHFEMQIQIFNHCGDTAGAAEHVSAVLRLISETVRLYLTPLYLNLLKKPAGLFH